MSADPGTAAPPLVEVTPSFNEFGIVAFTTTRQRGDFRLPAEAGEGAYGRWLGLTESLQESGVARLAMAHQVHGTHVVVHEDGWTGWLRHGGADGHLSRAASTAMAVTLADCVPVFVAHPSGAGGILHAGWRGTADGILAAGIARLSSLGLAAADLAIHLGPAICGRCYVVGPEVYGRLTGLGTAQPTPVDLRAVLTAQARAAGVRVVTSSASCTRCDNDRFFSHRAGDTGRQVGVFATARRVVLA